jgi:hypothetical protein
MDHGTAVYGQQKRRRRWTRWRDLFTSALKAADVILDSLSAIPGVGVEAIKEFKESVEAGVELGEAVDK